MITYTTHLTGSQEKLDALRKLLEWHRLTYNAASVIQFKEPENSIVKLHSKFYKPFRQANSEIPAQVLIRGEQECLAAYRSVKSNKHKIKEPITKVRISMRLDKRLYSRVKTKYGIKITTANGRQEFGFVVYPRLKELLDRYVYKDPLVYEDAGNLCVAFTFDTKPAQSLKQKLCLGVDLGIRVAAACSDGRLIIDKKYNAEKRRLRHLKRRLQSKGTKSARRHLRKIRHKEQNKNRNQTHLLANEILRTEADTIALENLKGLKAKRAATNKYQNQNFISQVPLAELRRIVTYKAENMGKTVTLVNPAYTSQTDSLTGNRDGKRQGRRYYAKSGLVYDADINAARNIGIRSKLPVSLGNLLDGQASVNTPNCCKANVCKPRAQANVLQVSIPLG